MFSAQMMAVFLSVLFVGRLTAFMITSFQTEALIYFFIAYSYPFSN